MENAAQIKVLLVEDEPLIRIVAGEAVADAGYVVIEATDAYEALIRMEANPDTKVLVTDVNMPGMDGVELARQIHARWPEVELVITSGKERLRESDIPDDGTFLPKPYRLSALVDLVGQKVQQQ